MKVLFCVYTCKSDGLLLEKFKENETYGCACQHDSFEVMEVYAGGCQAEYQDGVLTLGCEEAYTNLSIKTYEMIKYCLNHLDFDHLLKVDCTLGIDTRISDLIFSEYLYAGHYNGLRPIKRTNRRRLKWWKKLKGITTPVDFNKIYGRRDESVPFFVGKLYVLSRIFCEYIVNEGEPMAKEHVAFLGGSEDQMIGRLYQRFKNEQKIGLL